MSGWAIFHYAYLQNAVLAGLLGGAACAVVGVFVVTMHLSFLGVGIAHAAFAGALFSLLVGAPPLFGALLFGLVTAAAVGPLADRAEFGPDTATGILFSLMMGLAFLFLGLTPGAKTEALGLFWGSILTLTRGDVLVLAAVAGALAAFLILFYKEIQAVVCHRQVAQAVGIPAAAVTYGILLMTGLVIACALPGVGGLLVYTLVINPAAAAHQLTWRFRSMLLLAAVFGVLSCWTGLALSWRFNLPAGAVIVLVSTAVFAAAAVFSPKRKAARWTEKNAAA